MSEVKNPPEGCQRVIPYIFYEDAPAALEFLKKAFGFVERFRLAMDDGRVGHAELGLDGNAVMVASVYPEMGHATPKDLGHHHAMVYCYVDDVDAHYKRAKAAGAEITQELEDKFYGDRSYGATDPEGHHWGFATHVVDVPEDELEKLAAEHEM